VSTRPTLAAFAGCWQVERWVREYGAGTNARFEGRLTFTPCDTTLLAQEIGHLHLPGRRPLVAERCHIWRPAGQAIAVDFADGRRFHEIAPGPRPRARHRCPPDLYDALYDFTRWPVWRLLWRVDGPRKRQLIYSRMAPAY